MQCLFPGPPHPRLPPLSHSDQILLLSCSKPLNASHCAQNIIQGTCLGFCSQPIPLPDLLTLSGWPSCCSSKTQCSFPLGLCILVDSAGNVLLPSPCIAVFRWVSAQCHCFRKAFPDRPMAAPPTPNSKLHAVLFFFKYMSLPGLLTYLFLSASHTRKFSKKTDFSYSLLYLVPGRYLAHNRCSINNCWMSKWRFLHHFYGLPIPKGGGL